MDTADHDEEDMLMSADVERKEEKKPKTKPRAGKARFLSHPNSKLTNFDDDGGVSNIHQPPFMNNKLHIRSYSELEQHPEEHSKQPMASSASSEDSFDFDAESNADSTVYSRYVSMKKYKKQRHISRQFQEA
eukprot:767453_1